jgi:hypothetical protein
MSFGTTPTNTQTKQFSPRKERSKRRRRKEEEEKEEEETTNKQTNKQQMQQHCHSKPLPSCMRTYRSKMRTA